MKRDKENGKDAAKKLPLEASRRTERGPEPERFKIEGYADWKDAVRVALKKPKPPGGWPK